MPDDRAAPAAAPERIPLTEAGGNGAGRAAEFAELRGLLVGPEQRQLKALADRLDAMGVTAAELAELLPEAIALRGRRDHHLGRALAPTIETALRESIRRRPREIAAAIFPVLGPAIRKAIAETMANLVRSINTAVEHSLSPQGVQWRVESWRTGVPFAEIVIKHSLVYRVEQVFLIHAETGLLLSHVSAPELKVPDADLISGMLTAIQDFVRDSFRPAEGRTLRTFSVGDHTVHVEAGPSAVIAAVVRGQAPERLVRRLQDTLESIHLEFATQLAEFQGDAAPFEPVRPVLADCIETVVADRGATAPRGWIKWAIPLMLVVLAGSVMAVRAAVRWRRALVTLAAEPGIAVIEGSRGWGGWRVQGLKDPAARDPSIVLAEAGITESITGEWKPFLSLDSAIVVARARQALALPADVAISLRGDTVAFVGTIGLDRLPAVRSADRLPGIGAVDVRLLELRLSPVLDSLRRSVSGTLVRFDAGSAELTGAAGTTVAELAASVRTLVANVTGAGASVRIELVGRTDPSGSDDTNQDLARRRIERVTARFLGAGIAEAVLVPRPVATTQPLPSDDPAERARINRSVAVQISVASRPGMEGRP